MGGCLDFTEFPDGEGSEELTDKETDVSDMSDCVGEVEGGGGIGVSGCDVTWKRLEM